MKIKILMGIPASGKSSWAKEYCEKNTDWFRVNRDDIRHMRGKYWNPKDEDIITKIEIETTIIALNNNKNVILDATNLNEKYLSKFKQKILSRYPKIEFETKKFDITLEEAIKRDLIRPNSVGEKVIRRFHEKMYPEEYMTSKIKQDSSLDHIILCDIDGTIADKGDRSPFAWNKVINDTPRESILKLVASYGNNAVDKVIFFTGRDGNKVCADQTVKWLNNNLPLDWELGKKYELYMRAEDDNRKDSIVKKEMFDIYIRDKYYVDFVLDDRDQVVKMWRDELGLDCLQVNWGDF